jgi:hypothetical protein
MQTAAEAAAEVRQMCADGRTGYNELEWAEVAGWLDAHARLVTGADILEPDSLVVALDLWQADPKEAFG